MTNIPALADSLTEARRWVFVDLFTAQNLDTGEYAYYGEYGDKAKRLALRNHLLAQAEPVKESRE